MSHSQQHRPGRNWLIDPLSYFLQTHWLLAGLIIAVASWNIVHLIVFSVSRATTVVERIAAVGLAAIEVSIVSIWLAKRHQSAQFSLLDDDQVFESPAKGNHFRRLIETAPGAILLANEEGQLILVNEQLLSMFGYQREELIGQALDMLLPPHAARTHHTHLANFFAKPEVRTMGAGRELAGRRKDGSEFPIEIGLSYLETETGIIAAAFLTDISERKAAEEAVVNSERLLRGITNNFPGLISVKDLSGNVIMVNQNFDILEGPGHAEYLGKNIYDLFPKEVADDLWANDLAAQKANGPLESEETVTHNDGTQHTYLTTKFPLHRDDDMFATCAISIDITERILAESLTQQRANQLALLNTVGNQIVTMLDTDKLISQAPRLIQETFQYDHVAIFVIDPVTNQLVQQARAGYLADRFPEDHSLQIGQGIVGYVAKSGDELLVDDVSKEPRYFNTLNDSTIKSEWSVPIRDGQNVVGVLDIQSHHLAAFSENDLLVLRTLADQLSIGMRNARLFEQEQRQRALAQTIQQATEGITRSRNLSEALELIVSLLGDLVHNDRALVLVREHDHLLVAVSQGAAAGYEQGQTVPIGELPILLPMAYQDKRIWLKGPESLADSNSPPFYTPQTTGWVGLPLITTDVIIGYMCVATDAAGGYAQDDVEAIELFAAQAALAIGRSQIVEELQATQARLTQTARLAMAGEVAAGVAHQINNPLTAVIAQVYLASQIVEDDSELQNRIATIGQAATHAAHVVESMLDLGRIPGGSLQPTSINDSVQRALNMIRADIEPAVGRVELNLAENLPEIHANPRDLEDVWLNLLTNARDALGGQPDGKVEITTGLSETGHVMARFCDNGPGFDIKTKAQAFEPFFTTKTRGTGLGLAICHDIIIQHGGEIVLESSPGSGACFIITFPNDQPPTAAD